MITDINKKARKLKQMINAADTIAIIGHIRPDGDCIGSVTGLYNYISENSFLAIILHLCVSMVHTYAYLVRIHLLKLLCKQELIKE